MNLIPRMQSSKRNSEPQVLKMTPYVCHPWIVYKFPHEFQLQAVH